MRVNDNENQTLAHFHIFRASSPEIKRHLCFRDYLRGDPVALRAYADLKINLLKAYGHDRDAYSTAKAPFIQAAS
jgi:GrpB-like predicted nucleotidyltransferase (UPF0157 family)